MFGVLRSVSQLGIRSDDFLPTTTTARKATAKAFAKDVFTAQVWGSKATRYHPGFSYKPYQLAIYLRVPYD